MLALMPLAPVRSEFAQESTGLAGVGVGGVRVELTTIQSFV